MWQALLSGSTIYSVCLDNLLDQMSTAASVYHKPAELRHKAFETGPEDHKIMDISSSAARGGQSQVCQSQLAYTQQYVQRLPTLECLSAYRWL
jgi:hypothetical protein